MTESAAIDVLWEYALGTLDVTESAALEAELKRSASLREELAEVQEITSLMALAPPVEPTPSVRDRVLAGVEADRFAPFLDRLMRMYDLGRERMQEVLRAIDDASAEWVEEPVKGFFAYHFEAGPRVATADNGLIRMKPGTYFPHHRHFGEERAFVLQGAYRDGDGTIVRAGDSVTKPADSVHDYTAEPGPDLIFAVSLDAGIEFVGEDAPASPLYRKK